MNIKELLEQYSSVLNEIEDLQERIARIEKQITEMEESGYQVKDSVRGGEGGIQRFHISGYPYPEYSSKKTLLKIRQQQLHKREEKLLELTNAVEEFIVTIPDSRMRQMITYKYLDNLTWIQVAHKIGGGNTADGCRMAVERFMQSLN